MQTWSWRSVPLSSSGYQRSTEKFNFTGLKMGAFFEYFPDLRPLHTKPNTCLFWRSEFALSQIETNCANNAHAVGTGCKLRTRLIFLTSGRFVIQIPVCISTWPLLQPDSSSFTCQFSHRYTCTNCRIGSSGCGVFNQRRKILHFTEVDLNVKSKIQSRFLCGYKAHFSRKSLHTFRSIGLVEKKMLINWITHREVNNIIADIFLKEKTTNILVAVFLCILEGYKHVYDHPPCFFSVSLFSKHILFNSIAGKHPISYHLHKR